MRKWLALKDMRKAAVFAVVCEGSQIATSRNRTAVYRPEEDVRKIQSEM
jgi:hypothetical protein